MKYSINIIGSGTAEEIIENLESIIESVKEADKDPFFTETEWADPTLYTEFCVNDSSKEQHEINRTDLKEMATYYGGWEELKKVIYDIEVNEAEAAHESFVNDFYGGPSYQQAEQHRMMEAQKLK